MEIINIDRYSSVLFLDDMEPLEIRLSDEEANNGIDISLMREVVGELFSESYLSDFENKVVIDLRALIGGDFSSTVPEPGVPAVQYNAYRTYYLTISSGDGEPTTLTLDVLGCSSDVLNAMTDIDIMRVPRDYVLPLSCHHEGESDGVDFIMPDSTVVVPDYFPDETGNPELQTILIALSDTPAASASSFKVKITGKEIYSPNYFVCSGHFEQYLFVNRFGGFDNIAMSGDLMLQADTNHETGKYEGLDVQRDSTITKQWLQHSGYVSRKCVDAFAALICSGQIYHLKDGDWRRIVIVKSDVQYNNSDDLHSFSFMFRYTDSSYTGFRPFT